MLRHIEGACDAGVLRFRRNHIERRRDRSGSDRFARPEWREIEDQWTNGRITAAQCMRRQIQLLQAKHEDIDAFLDTIEIDSAFGAFKAFCEENGLSLTIVSDGVDHFIRRVLAKHGLEDIQIIANKLISRPHACTMPDFDLGFPFKSAACAAGAGVCKCAQVRPSGNHIYIGDGPQRLLRLPRGAQSLKALKHPEIPFLAAFIFVFAYNGSRNFNLELRPRSLLPSSSTCSGSLSSMV